LQIAPLRRTVDSSSPRLFIDQPMRPPRFLVVATLSVVLSCAAARAQEKDPAAKDHPARLLPETSLVYFELSQPEKLIELATNPGIWELYKRANGVEALLRSEQFKHLQAAVELVEKRLDMKWPAALRELTGGGIYVGVEPLAAAGLVIVKPRKPELLTKLHEAAMEMIEAETKRRGAKSPVKSEQYSGVTGWSFGGNEYHAIVGDMLVLSNNSGALKALVDRFRGESSRSLWGVKEFQQARKDIAAEQIGWGMARLAPLHVVPGIGKALSGPSDNPVAELLVGGVLETVKSAPYATFSLHLADDQLRLRLGVPHDPAKIAAKRKWFFATEPAKIGPGKTEPGKTEPGKAAYAPLAPPRTILSWSGHLDLSGMWLAREELFTEEVIAGLSQADSGLGLFFSGRDFGTEVLGAVTPRLQFVATRQEFAKDEPALALKLPAFALVFDLKKPDEFGKHMLLAYQKVIGLTNVVGGMNGQPQALMDMIEYQGVKISRATFLVEPKTDKKAAPIQSNFTPSCAQVGNRFILSSTVGLARELIDEFKKPGTTKLTSDLTTLRIDMRQLAAILGDNKEPLITRSLLQEGHSRPEATSQVNLLLDVLQAVRTAGLSLKAADGQLVLEMAVGVPKYK
jgi:hypothetical protein